MIALYYYPGNASMAPHMALEETGAPFELRLVDRDNAGHKQPDYLRLNPNGLIPACVDGDLVLFESAAICLHIADRFPAARLIPPVGTAERSEVYKWLIHLTNTVQSELLLYFYPERLTDDANGAAQVKKHAETRVAGMMDRIEQALSARGPFLAGANFSVADLYLFMLVRWTRGMTRPAAKLPAIRRLMEAVAARPAVARAMATEKMAPPWF